MTKKEIISLMRNRQFAKEDWEYWSHKIGDHDFLSSPERGQVILDNSRRTYGALVSIEDKLRELRKF